MNVKLFAAAAAAAILTTTPLAAGAQVSQLQLHPGHYELYQAVQATGVKVYINPPSICTPNGPQGAYIGTESSFVVCQDNAKGGDLEVTWTANDLDTLRHEAQHLVQDCQAIRRGNQNLVNTFRDIDELMAFVYGSGFTQSQINAIMINYAGSPPEVLRLELEAFAVARSVRAEDIAGAIRNVCSVQS